MWDQLGENVFLYRVGDGWGFCLMAKQIKNDWLYRYQPVKVLNYRFLKHRTVEIFTNLVIYAVFHQESFGRGVIFPL